MSMPRVVFASLLFSVATATVAINPVQGELEILPATRVENLAGVWLDGQYIGYVKNLRGRGKLVLVPGEHELLFKLVGYQDLSRTVVIEPGEDARYRVAMLEEPDVTYPDKAETAKVRMEIEPSDAAIFVNDNFVGHVDRFDGYSGMRLKAGTYRFTIALPGYESFETELTLRAGQTYEIKTDLSPGSLDDQAEALTIKQ
jgi:PEGA domain